LQGVGREVAEGLERGRVVLERLGGRLKVKDGHFGKTLEVMRFSERMGKRFLIGRQRE
jgi:hypothetical protein